MLTLAPIARTTPSNPVNQCSSCYAASQRRGHLPSMSVKEWVVPGTLSEQEQCVDKGSWDRGRWWAIGGVRRVTASVDSV
jgi:hypothetical protein